MPRMPMYPTTVMAADKMPASSRTFLPVFMLFNQLIALLLFVFGMGIFAGATGEQIENRDVDDSVRRR